MTQRLLRLLKITALWIALFMGYKLVFLAVYAAGRGVVAGDWLAVMAHGFKLDLSTTLYLVALPYLLSVADIWLRMPRVLWRIYWGVMAAAVGLALVADGSMYAFWQQKLDAAWLDYLSQPQGITESVSTGYLIVRGLLWVVVSGGIYLMGDCFTERASERRYPCWKEGLKEGLKGRWVQTAAYLLLLPLLIIGIRGGVGDSTMNVGQAYYSQNQFLNHATVNPVFNFVYTLSHRATEHQPNRYFSDEECQALTANIYTTESLSPDTLISSAAPLHILVILMEGCGEEFAPFMPQLQALKSEGVSFDSCYANSWRTDRGTVCALSGYPSFPTFSVMKNAEKSATMPSIARSLGAKGYATHFIYGGDLNFTNQRGYLVSTGWQRLTGWEDFSKAERETARWGVRDDLTFRYLYKMMAQAGPHPTLTGFTTLSSHEPWDVPTHTIKGDAMANSFAYLDQCLATFVRQMKRLPVWKNLLIVLTADHGINYKQIGEHTPRLKNRIPMLWIGGAVKQPRRVATLCNQSDLPATLLGQLGISHSEFTFSRDVLSQSYRYPTAVHNYSNAQCIIDSTGCLLYDIAAKRTIVCQTADSARLLRVNKAILQLTSQDFSNR